MMSKPLGTIRSGLITQIVVFIAIVLVSAVVVCSEEPDPVKPAEYAKYTDFWPSSSCLECHAKLHDQHSESMHAKSYTNPVFQAQYFRELLPKTRNNPRLTKEAGTCIACHSPIAYINRKGPILSKDQVDSRMSGVTCDLCHTIKAYEGEKPENGNYITQPGVTKLGPFITESNWHHSYSELQTRSEFCAICHNAVNQYGLEIKSTFTEWKNSRYAEEGIQCQDCHMNVQGFLTGGKPHYESGKAANISLANPPDRGKLYTHRFPGARTKTQIVGALTLEIDIREQHVAPGDTITIDVLVDNSRTGHKMPSGSADLRLMLIDLHARSGRKRIPVLADPSSEAGGFDVSGKGPFDAEILGKDFPSERRIYRAVFVDTARRQTLSSYDAVKIVFDNRLNPAEIRKETYRLTVPADWESNFKLKAELSYYPYPPAFSRKLDIAEPEPVIVAAMEKTVELGR
jgi:hypothetical protein